MYQEKINDFEHCFRSVHKDSSFHGIYLNGFIIVEAYALKNQRFFPFLVPVSSKQSQVTSSRVGQMYQ